jgi:drug/metabolite transporter superfamily protein YnfA
MVGDSPLGTEETIMSWPQVWAWLHTPHAVWWLYGGGMVCLLLIGVVKTLVVKKKRQRRRMGMGPVNGARSPMRNGRD